MPKVAKDGKIVDAQPIALSAPCMDEINNPKVTKMLITTDRDGTPHCVCKQTIAMLDGEFAGCLAFMEMIEGSQSSKNLLWDFDMKRAVAVSLFNPENQKSYQIKGMLFKYVYEGPVWTQFLEKTWDMYPLAEPAGTWIIIPTEERDQNFAKRMEEEDSRLLPPHHQWYQYRDTSFPRRHGKA